MQRTLRNHYEKEATINMSILQWYQQLKKTVFLCKKKSTKLAKRLGRSSEEGEAKFCPKFTEVYGSCHLYTLDKPENGMGNFTISHKFQAVSFAIDTTNNRGRKVSICAGLQTFDRVMVQNIWNELDYGLDVCCVTREQHREH
ncbi:hypothetical protein TNCV_1833761 [Trichonephila clavipes]|nr:hypothetical protein TNCV_1833761 [Trichonephila clavipes]